MSTVTTASPIPREPELLGQTVVVIGGSAGIGLETARRARAEGANLILTARDPGSPAARRHRARGASIAAFDATDFERLAQFFDELPRPIDHVLVTGPGPYYAPLAELDFEEARRDLDVHLLLPLQVARHAAPKMRPGGTLLFMGGTGGRRTAVGFALISALTAALPAMAEISRLSSRPFGSTSSPPASSTHRCRQRCSAMNSKTAAISFAPRFPSGASWDRPTSPRSPYTS